MMPVNASSWGASGNPIGVVSALYERLASVWVGAIKPGACPVFHWHGT